MSKVSPGLRIQITGIVQGVGFRPFIFNLARSMDLKGWVRNTSGGVEIEVTGSTENLQVFLLKIQSIPPPLSRIDSIRSEVISGGSHVDFSILDSHPSTGDFIPVSPDVAICSDCRAELFDPSNRRYMYPFINCTNCGPRFTILQDIPYDRQNTTMANFPMCEACASEYNDPSNRRYHAQPIACPVCGPNIIFSGQHFVTEDNATALSEARAAIKAGKILAIKGLGGYHLACDASNHQALDRLRKRKLRTDKPFALMAHSLEIIKKYTHISAFEESLLSSPQHPIVLLDKKEKSQQFDQTAPSQNCLGFMLPYTPLHLLLLQPEPGFPDVLVMTSGNVSEEPIAYDDLDAHNRLSGIADCYLTHNRPIHMRVDDSVVRIFNGQAYPIRRSRGYAPDPLTYPIDLPEILACGAELKNTFSLSKNSYVFMSHHIGDLENLETLQSFEEGITHYRTLFRVNPRYIAVDLHPDYLSTHYGIQLADENHLPLYQIQHHHAHLAACLADNRWTSTDSVIGLIFDGTGYGTDGKIWGGEVLLGGFMSFKRPYHLRYTALPGGDTAIRNPAKIALSHLFAAGLDWETSLPSVSHFSEEQLTILQKQLRANINCPQTSSMGRLFDAVSSILGIRQRATYEGQAAIELENACEPLESTFYSLPVVNNEIDFLELYPQILGDIKQGVSINRISSRFHNAIAQVCLHICNSIRDETSCSTVALSGGVWQNMTLLGKTSELLQRADYNILTHHRVSTNDGGISLGQILVTKSLLEQD